MPHVKNLDIRLSRVADHRPGISNSYYDIVQREYTVGQIFVLKINYHYFAIGSIAKEVQFN